MTISTADVPFLPPLDPPRRAPRKRKAVATMPEDKIQRAVFAHLRSRGVPDLFAFHPANGGKHQAGRAAGIHAGLGVVSGVPDVVIICGARLYGLELKTETGRLSLDQVTAQAVMRAAGCVTATVYGLDQAIAKLESWGLLRGRTAIRRQPVDEAHRAAAEAGYVTTADYVRGRG